MRLNAEQASAVKYIDNALLVLAGAGSGKTRVITQKIVYLVKECGYKANTVYAVTFTNKAAKEMKERVGQVLPRPLRRGLTVSTFHHLGLTILKSAPALFSLRKGFSIFDSSDSLSLIQQLLHRNHHRDKDFLQSVQSCISNWKNDAVLPENIASMGELSPIAQAAGAIYEAYTSHLRVYNAVDFDDLILLPLLAFKTDLKFREKWQNKIRYLLVDEYQDTNRSQYQLVKELVGVSGHLTVVGDDSQSVYAWRGARPENLNLLSIDFPKLKIIKLEQNYRSSGCILKASNQLITYNQQRYEKKLWSDLGFGELIRVIYCKDEFDEAGQVASEIMSHKLRFQNEFGQYAVLYRGNHQARLFEKAFRDLGIPYRLSGGQSFFARTEIKDIFSYLRLLVNPDDDNAFLRIVNTPKRGIGKSTIEAIAKMAATRGSGLFKASTSLGLESILSKTAFARVKQFSAWLLKFADNIHQCADIKECLHELVSDISYEAYLYDTYEEPTQAERRMSNITDMINWIDSLMHKKEDEPLSIDEVVAKLILLDVLDRGEEDAKDEVQLLTLHASKGLEFPFVFMVGMEEELLPHKTSIEEENVEEERRLAYVGVTRAQRELTLTLARKRRRYGEMIDCIPSRFIEELPKEVLVCEGLKSDERTPKKAAAHLDSLKALLTKKNEALV